MARKGPKPIQLDIAKLEELASRGLNNEQIAHCMGIAAGTLYAKKAASSEIDEAIKRGKASGVKQVANALFENAMGGNVTAQIFFLKNRGPEEWKDRTEQKIDHTHEFDPERMTDAELAAIAATGSARAAKAKRGKGKPTRVH